MLHKAKTLKGYTLDSLDGEIGKVKEFYFDDLHWTIRYLVADTGSWHTARQVLISPYALISVDKEEQRIAIDLTKKQIEDIPSLDRDKPVSRQFEEDYQGHHGWPNDWMRLKHMGHVSLHWHRGQFRNHEKCSGSDDHIAILSTCCLVLLERRYASLC